MVYASGVYRSKEAPIVPTGVFPVSRTVSLIDSGYYRNLVKRKFNMLASHVCLLGQSISMILYVLRFSRPKTTKDSNIILGYLSGEKRTDELALKPTRAFALVIFLIRVVVVNWKVMLPSSAGIVMSVRHVW